MVFVLSMHLHYSIMKMTYFKFHNTIHIFILIARTNQFRITIDSHRLDFALLSKTIDSFLVKRDDEGPGLGQRHYAGSSSGIVVIEEDECVL